MESLHKNNQLTLEFLKNKDYILGPTLFQLYINDVPDDAICNIAIMLMILLSKCDQASI